MNSKEVAEQLAKKGPPQERRADHGQWVEPAEAVYNLVTRERWNVSDAVREVVTKFKFKDVDRAFNGVRAAYYVLRNRREEEFDI